MSVGFLLVMGAVASWPQAAPIVPYVRQVDYVVETMEGGTSTREEKSLYVLYVGNPETERLDRLAERAGIARTVCLVHPVDGGAPNPSGVSTGPAGNGWYVTENDSERGIVRRAPLLNRVAWYTVPIPARHAFLALDPDDADLILISWNRVSGSLSIYFSPSRQADGLFYEKKLELLRSYLEAHGSESEVPYERVEPFRAAGVLTDS